MNQTGRDVHKTERTIAQQVLRERRKRKNKIYNNRYPAKGQKKTKTSKIDDVVIFIGGLVG